VTRVGAGARGSWVDEAASVLGDDVFSSSGYAFAYDTRLPRLWDVAVRHGLQVFRSPQSSRVFPHDNGGELSVPFDVTDGVFALRVCSEVNPAVYLQLAVNTWVSLEVELARVGHPGVAVLHVDHEATLFESDDDELVWTLDDLAFILADLPRRQAGQYGGAQADVLPWHAPAVSATAETAFMLLCDMFSELDPGREPGSEPELRDWFRAVHAQGDVMRAAFALVPPAKDSPTLGVLPWLRSRSGLGSPDPRLLHTVAEGVAAAGGRGEPVF
jgi:hypothetical protein